MHFVRIHEDETEQFYSAEKMVSEEKKHTPLIASS